MLPYRYDSVEEIHVGINMTVLLTIYDFECLVAQMRSF